MRNSLIYKVLKRIHWHYRYCSNEVKDLFSEYFNEKKVGISTSERVHEREDKSANNDEVFYMPMSYRDIKYLVNFLKVASDDVFVDLGCGMGRVTIMFARQKIKRSIGIELRQSVFQIAQKNKESAKGLRSPVEFIHNDVLNVPLENVTIFFMFNPFGIKTLTQLVANIHKSLETNPRKIKIVYYHSGQFDCKQMLDSVSWLDGGEKQIHPERHMYLYQN